jgi:hypothetical protein
MTEKELQMLGFNGSLVKDENWGIYYYYSYEISKNLKLVSNSSDGLKDGEEWYVEFHESDPPIRFYKFGEVQGLINNLEKHKEKQ